MVIDLETTGLGWESRVLCISVSWYDEDGKICSKSVNTGMQDLFTTPCTVPEARAFVQDAIKGATWIAGHNLSFDIPFLIRDGLLSQDQLVGRVFDTLVMARCTASHAACGLEDLCNEYSVPFNSAEEERQYSAMKKNRSRLSDKDASAVMRYCELDTERNLRLASIVYELAKQQYKNVDEFIREEGDYVLLVSTMRVHGIPLNVDGIRREVQTKRERIKALHKGLMELRIQGFNDRSGILSLLRQHRVDTHLGATPGGGLSVDEANLRNLPYVDEYLSLEEETDPDEAARAKLEKLRTVDYVRAVSMILEGRELEKQITTWLLGFLDVAGDDGRVHPLWGVGSTVSFRLNCTHPNAQAVSKKVSVFAIDLQGDFSQAELRLGAMFGEEDLMAETFYKKIDFHAGTAKQMGRSRRDAKTANFSGFYGGGAAAIERALHCGMEIATEITQGWRTTFRNVWRNNKVAERLWVTRGYLKLAWGKHLWASPDDIARRPYKAFNQLVQASVSEIIKRSMLRIWREVPEVIIVGQIHDSILLLWKDANLPSWRKREIAYKCKHIMEEGCPEYVQRRTNPRIDLIADFEPNPDDISLWVD